MRRKYRLKTPFINLSKIVIFLSIVILILTHLSPIFEPKNNNKASGIHYENEEGFYGEDPKTVDILFIGNSDLYSAMNPLQLWKEHGYTSYVCAEPQQTIFGAYYMLQQVFTCQSPKLVVLEVDELFATNEADDIDEAINNALKYTFPLFKYHSRWKDLKIEDFNDKGKYYNTRMQSKGYLYHSNIEPNTEGFAYMNKNKRSSITKANQAYLKKFIQLANENGAEVMLVWYPSATTGSNGRSETLMKLANQLNLPYIDFNVNQYDTGFDWMTDSRDGGNHLNFSGASKFTKYMGNYISQNYNLKDHRKNPAYEQWNKDYESFKKQYHLQ